MRIDISDCSGIRSIKKKIHDELCPMIEEFLKTNFEEEEGDVLQIGTDNFAAVVAEGVDKDGFSTDICITLTPVIKTWTQVGESVKRVVEPYDRFEEHYEYLESQKQKKKKEQELN